MARFPRANDEDTGIPAALFHMKRSFALQSRIMLWCMSVATWYIIRVDSGTMARHVHRQLRALLQGTWETWPTQRVSPAFIEFTSTLSSTETGHAKFILCIHSTPGMCEVSCNAWIGYELNNATMTTKQRQSGARHFLKKETIQWLSQFFFKVVSFIIRYWSVAKLLSSSFR